MIQSLFCDAVAATLPTRWPFPPAQVSLEKSHTQPGRQPSADGKDPMLGAATAMATLAFACEAQDEARLVEIS